VYRVVDHWLYCCPVFSLRCIVLSTIGCIVVLSLVYSVSCCRPLVVLLSCLLFTVYRVVDHWLSCCPVFSLQCFVLSTIGFIVVLSLVYSVSCCRPLVLLLSCLYFTVYRVVDHWFYCCPVFSLQCIVLSTIGCLVVLSLVYSVSCCRPLVVLLSCL
jgi:uncharacterized membrane protein YeaQ/YmgE (transglycosylase-associated protein family)